MRERGENELGRSRFEYSPENPPPLKALETKLFAVHATPILPKNGVLKAGARDISYDKRWGGEPPSFRPTIHFALGELVREHRDISWDDKPYAVVTPLKALESQLVNVFPHDTFVLGDYKLTPEAILLVPRGTRVAGLPSGLQIVEYGGGTNLRQAVDQVIRDKNGWTIRMEPEGVSIGSVAYINNTEINSADFFKSLFEKYPEISFGTHLNPEMGNAFRFGIIEQAVISVMKNYSDHWNMYSTSEVKLHNGLIVHNLAKLEEALKRARNLTPEAFEAFEDKKRRLEGWINIINADLDARERFGVTLTGVSEDIQKKVRKQRHDPEELRRTMESLSPKLQPIPDEKPISPALLAEMLNGFNPQELKEFMSHYPDAFRLTDMNRFYANYTVDRWIVIGTKRARAEGLDGIIENSIPKFSPEPRKDGEPDLFRDLEGYLTTENNRLAVAIDILRQPGVMRYLTRQYGFNFPPGGVKNLPELIKAHPKTRAIVEPKEMQVPLRQQLAYNLLKALKTPFQPRYSLEEMTSDFRKANNVAFEMEWDQDSMERDLQTIVRPMNTIRKPDDIMAGDWLTLYEQYKRGYKDAAEIWRKVSLDKEFRRRFPNDKLFWQSSLSMLQIYQLLQSDKAKE